MKPTKKQKLNEEVVPAVDVELNEEQLEIVAGGGGNPLKDFWDTAVHTIETWVNPKLS